MPDIPVLPLVLLALACSGSGEQAAPEAASGPELQRVRLALNWVPEPEFGGFYEGVAGGHYEAAGFEVEILPGGPGAPTLELLTSGKAEAAITVADDLLLKRQRGVEAVAVFAAFQVSPLGLMAHSSLGLSGPEAIGQTPDVRVAIEVGGPFHTFLWRRYGWEGKVEAVPKTSSVGPFLADPRMVQQAYITSEPCVARAKGAEVDFLEAAQAGWNPYGVVLALPEPLPDWAPAFVEATSAGWAAYLADPSRTDARLAELNPDLDAALLACISEAQRPFVTGEGAELGAMTAERWQATWASLVSLGELPEDGSPEGAWRWQGGG